MNCFAKPISEFPFIKHSACVFGWPLNGLNSLVGGLVGGLIGWLAWGNESEPWALILLLLLPAAWGMSKSRKAAGTLFLGYFLCSARDLPHTTAIFFGENAPEWTGWGLWAVACLVLTIPFMALWSVDSQKRPWRFVLAICVLTIPPLGLIGWVNPISFAGVVFPRMEWGGLILAMILMAMLTNLTKKWKNGLMWFLVISIVANVFEFTRNESLPAEFPNWAGVNTNFEKMDSGEAVNGEQGLMASVRAAWVEKYAKTIPPNSVRILPETFLGPFTYSAQATLIKTEMELSSRNSRILIGTEIEESPRLFANTMIVLGTQKNEDQKIFQGIPVPVAMWKPWVDEGATADIWGHRGVIKIDKVRAGVLICYEQFLTFSILQTMWNKPELLVGASNVWWAKNTSLPLVQDQMMNVFGRLFGTRTILAKNT